jgi:hypothetical protein
MLIVVVCGFCCRNRRCSPATWPSCPANLALVVLLVLCRSPCPHRAGVLASIALLSLPTLCWRCYQRRAGLFALIAPALPPALQISVCPTKAQLQHIRVCGVVVVVIVLARGLIAVPNHSMGTWPQMVWRMQRWCLCWCCAGILCRIAPVSSPTLRCCCCRHCAGIIALVAWALLSLSCWHCCPRCLCIAASIANWHLSSHEAVATCAGVIASIALLLLPALRRHRCPRCMGAFSPAALMSPPLAHPHRHQHHELASAQS